MVREPGWIRGLRRCQRKKSYKTWQEAEEALQGLLSDIRAGVAKDKKTKGHLGPYLCPHIDERGRHWHVGHGGPRGDY